MTGIIVLTITAVLIVCITTWYLAWHYKGQPCRHTNRTTTFKDVHRGGGQQTGIYIRAYHHCKQCGWHTCTAVELPTTALKQLHQQLAQEGFTAVD